MLQLCYEQFLQALVHTGADEMVDARLVDVVHVKEQVCGRRVRSGRAEDLMVCGRRVRNGRAVDLMVCDHRGHNEKEQSRFDEDHELDVGLCSGEHLYLVVRHGLDEHLVVLSQLDEDDVLRIHLHGGGSLSDHRVRHQDEERIPRAVQCDAQLLASRCCDSGN